MFANIYKGKTVLITGHTGFKGSWLATWLIKLGAKVVGVSNEIPTNPSMFEIAGIADHMTDTREDIRNLEGIKKIILDIKPDFVFHLAAQAIVSTSYKNPVDTLETNVMGTANILEALRNYTHPCVAIFITSDKCYDNVEWIWGYRETDHLGGKDIYSGSKGAAELVIKSYRHSFFGTTHPVRIGIGRAGNVIGGGDWAIDRLVVDCMCAWNEGRNVEIRSPQATRPWQHVLEPLSGYLRLGQTIFESAERHGEAYNFGPRAEQNQTVVNLLHDLAQKWGFKNTHDAYLITDNIPFHEAGLLKLNCDKALSHLKWESTLGYPETISLISDWYIGYYKAHADMWNFTLEQINTYEQKAVDRNRSWAKS